MLFAKKFTPPLRLPVRASLWYVGTSVVTKSVGFLATPIFTRALTEEEYGVFSLYVSVLGVVSILVSVLTSGSTVYIGLGKFTDNIRDFYRSLICSALAFSVVICALLFVFSPILKLNFVFCLLILFQVSFDAFVGIYLSALRFSYLYKGVAALGIFEAIAAPLAAVFLITLGVNGALARIISLLSVSLIAAIYALSKLLKKGGRARLEMIKYAFRESLPLLPHTASSAVTSSADKFVITAVSGAAALAKYSVVHSVSAALSFIVSAIGSALTPWILRHSKKEDEGRVGNVLLLLFRILAMLTLFLLAVIPEAVKILAPPEYSEATVAALPIALSTLPAFLTSISTIGITHSGNSRHSVRIALISACINILLNFLLIPHFGFLGAGSSLLVSQSVGAVLAVLYLKKCGKSYFTEMGKIVSCLLVTLFFGLLIFICKDFPALRVLLLIFPAIIALNSLFAARGYVTEA